MEPDTTVVPPRTAKEMYGFKGPVKRVEIRTYELFSADDTLVDSSKEIVAAFVVHEFSLSGDEVSFEKFNTKSQFIYDNAHEVIKSVQADSAGGIIQSKEFSAPDECGKYTKIQTFGSLDSLMPVAVDSLANSNDSFCRNTEQKVFRNGTLFQVTETQYTVKGQVARRVVRSGSGYSERRFSYDSRNKVITETTFDSTGMENGRIEYAYDVNSISKNIYTNGYASGFEFTNDLAVDNYGNCIKTSYYWCSFPVSSPGAIYRMIRSKFEYY
jgi:hypothetical protein